MADMDIDAMDIDIDLGGDAGYPDDLTEAEKAMIEVRLSEKILDSHYASSAD
jgi:hypothetical protein